MLAHFFIRLEDDPILVSLRHRFAAYNSAVFRPQRQNDSPHRHRRGAIYAAETSGLLFIAFLIIVLTVVRYWHAIHWSVR